MQVLKEIITLLEKYKDEEVSITITGHSMGAAIAQLNAVDIILNKYNYPTGQADKPIPVTAIVFASPRVGDRGFKQLYDELKVKAPVRILRIANADDDITIIPRIFYVPVGEELIIDTTKSPFLKDVKKTVHDLEVYLHGVAGLTQGSGNDFEFAISRDHKLINKNTDGLKDEYKIPSNWWTEE
ncbi:conserved hypothetical protein [Ricinus communis]|uniref:Phospholipase A1 n=1 Tax=Ricinus communis TaxID=3988 RepID=B9STK7_RICCO|nr:conserved hypothetical protein [Ricinus communis]